MSPQRYKSCILTRVDGYLVIKKGDNEDGKKYGSIGSAYDALSQHYSRLYEIFYASSLTEPDISFIVGRLIDGGSRLQQLAETNKKQDAGKIKEQRLSLRALYQNLESRL